MTTGAAGPGGAVGAAAGGQRRRASGQWLRIAGLLWRLCPGRVVGLVLATVVVALTPALQLTLTARAVQAVADAVVAQDATVAARPILAVGLLLAAVSVLAHLCGAWQLYLDAVVRLELSASVSVAVMDKGTRMELQDYEDAGSYDTLQRAFQESSGARIQQVQAETLGFTRELITIASVAVVLFSWNPWVALLILVSPVPSALSQMRYGTRMFDIEHDRAADRRRLLYYQYLATTDHSFKEVRLFGLGPHLIARYRALVERFLRVDRGINRRQSLALAGLGLVSVLVAAGAAVLAMLVTAEGGRVGELAAYLQAVAVMQIAAHTMLLNLASLQQHGLFIANLFALLDLPERRITGGPLPFPDMLVGGIEFREVSFTYPGTDRPVLDRVSFTLPAGSCTAIVGHNGAGKTTLVKLLTRLYEPTAGEILVNGVPIECYDLDDLRRRMGVIFQDYIRYELTARDNIGFGCVEHRDDEARIRAAAAAGGAAPVLEALPGGYDAMLGRHFEDGCQLSGGQWQKVALARAFMRSAPVVVLDEPTASIDAEAEVEIFGRLREIAGTATSLLIAHRFSTVRMADKIIVLDKGRVVEEGTHAGLLGAGGHYAFLFSLQAAGYRTEPADIAAGRS